MIVTKVIQYKRFCLLSTYVKFKTSKKGSSSCNWDFQNKMYQIWSATFEILFYIWGAKNVIFRIQAFCTFASLLLLESLAFTQNKIITVIFRKHLRSSTNLFFNEFKVHYINLTIIFKNVVPLHQRQKIPIYLTQLNIITSPTTNFNLGTS